MTLQEEIQKELDFIRKITNNQNWVKQDYFHLIVYFLGEFYEKRRWDNEIIPLIESISIDESNITDWGSFPWNGEVCFRKENVYLLDESIFEVGNKLFFITMVR